MNKLLKRLIGRLPLFLFLIALQFAAIIFIIANFSAGNGYYLTIMTAFGFVVVFYIVSRDDHPAYKIPWIIVVLAAPVFGVPFYIIFGPRGGGRKFAREMARYQEHYEREMRTTLPHPKPEILEQLRQVSPHLARQADYITTISSGRVWNHTEVEFFALGELAFRQILKEIELA
ncbi:MAG: PLDc N-terminal domain-containing protein, partial [Sphaerochaetaceae bacterium]